MKKIMSLILMICMFFTMGITSIANFDGNTYNKANLKINEINNNNEEIIINDNTKLRIVYLEYKNINNDFKIKDSIGTMSQQIEEGGAGGGAILYVTYQGVTRMFNVTAHALERIMDRFNGNWSTVEQILTRGNIYKDLTHGGYAIYNSSNALCLTEDLTTIKTVMDNVSIWDKLTSKVWEILETIISLW